MLPHLLSLPRGVVAGVSLDVVRACRRLSQELAAFGPLVASDVELRHAAHRPPATLVVDTERSSSPVLAAALAALRHAGAVVVLRAEDRGRLLEWCDRLLVGVGAGVSWVTTDAVRAGRCLLLRVGTGGRWIRIPMGRGAGAESVLAACGVRGIRVAESRIAYEAPRAR